MHFLGAVSARAVTVPATLAGWWGARQVLDMYSLLLSSFCVLASAAPSILDIATGSPDHTRFVAILTSGSYPDVLSAASGATKKGLRELAHILLWGPFPLRLLLPPSPLTVFAPTNDAFAAAEQALGFDFAATTDAAQIAAVKDVLLYHVMGGANDAGTLVGAYNTATVQGSQAIVKADPDAVILGKTAVPITANFEASNGWVHVTSAVILIPDTIAKIASATAPVSTLYAVLGLPEYADILAVVAGATAAAPLTVFAPTNDAFAAAGIDVPFVTDPKNIDTVKQILKYHVAPANVFAGALADGASADVPTAEGMTVKVSKANDGGVTVDAATVAVGDVLASNGVVHVIDKVLMPSDLPGPPPAGPQSILDIATGSPDHTRF
eukprot:gene4618-4822_t